MHAVDLVTAGDAFDDLVFAGLPRLPRPGEELKTRTLVRTFGGGAIITAVAAARLGMRCAVLTAAGPDAVQWLARERVQVINFRRRGEPTALTAALSTSRERGFITYIGANDRLEPRLLKAMARIASRHVHLALQPAKCNRWIPVINRLRSRGITTSWDFGWNPDLVRDRAFMKLVSALDYLFLNAQEAQLYRGAAGRVTIVKLGARGARWVAAGTRLFVAAPRLPVVDTTGAGDAFNGGFLYALLQEKPPRECLRVANAVGARSTQAAGGLDALPRRGDLA